MVSKCPNGLFYLHQYRWYPQTLYLGQSLLAKLRKDRHWNAFHYHVWTSSVTSNTETITIVRLAMQVKWLIWLVQWSFICVWWLHCGEIHFYKGRPPHSMALIIFTSCRLLKHNDPICYQDWAQASATIISSDSRPFCTDYKLSLIRQYKHGSSVCHAILESNNRLQEKTPLCIHPCDPSIPELY